MNNFFQKNDSQSAHHLGDFSVDIQPVLNTQKLIELCKSSLFQKKTLHEKYTLFFHALIEQIMGLKEQVFLFPELVRLFETLKNQNLLTGVHFSYFELWLNQFSQLSDEDNYKVRAKICGKYIPRDLYQLYFPVGQNKSYFGAHFVTAHSSPDLDTTVASFWGWLDAFAARIGAGLHHWNVPGGAPSYQVEFKLIFDEIFSSYLFEFSAKHRGALQVTALELLTQKGIVKKSIDSSSLSIDLDKSQEAIVLVDNDGYFHGDWRSQDIEGVRQVVMLVNQLMRHFENNFQKQLITLLSQDDLKKQQLVDFINSQLTASLRDFDLFKDISERQRKHVSDYLVQVLGVKEGLDATLIQMADGLESKSVGAFVNFTNLILEEANTRLFDKQGVLIADRKIIFEILDRIMVSLDEAIHATRRYVDQLKITLEIKSKVFGYKPLYVSEKADVEELRSKMGNNAYLTVTMNDEKGLLPIGVIYAQDLYKTQLGTCTLRDFSNRDETKVPAYLEVVSVIDHHKSQLSGSVPATIYISDAQSSNVITSQLAFKINEEYSTYGMSKESILEQLASIDVAKASNSQRRIYKKLISKLEALDKRGHYFIDPRREFIEYQHFLFAILDDTDMLSKVTRHDVEIVKELINKMKSIILKQEVEVIHFDDISEGEAFTQTAAARLLRNADLASITHKIYQHKEVFIDQILQKAACDKDLLFFADTKEQNGCCRIGQFKMYPINHKTYTRYAYELKEAFIEESLKVSTRKKEVDLHIFMISTLAGLDSAFDKKEKNASFQDEVWLYIPEDSEGGYAHLRAFLNSFGASSGAQKAVVSIKQLGQSTQVKDLVEESILSKMNAPFTFEKSKWKGDLVVLNVTPGSMNSRKAMITPYLPKLAL